MQELSCLCVRIRLFIACDFFFSRVYLIFCISGGIWQHRKKNAENITIPKRNWTNEHELDKQTKKNNNKCEATHSTTIAITQTERNRTLPIIFFVFLWYFVLPSIPNCPYRHWRLFEVDLVIYFSYFCLLDVWFFFVHFYLLVNITLIRMQYSQSIIINDAEFFWIKFL